MPISDCEGYDTGHFKRVYEDIIKPSVNKAGFTPKRADDVKQTNLIHLDILKQLIDAPIAVCDLSSRNPNVLFELGIRQAFDKPVVLIQEKGTPKIFDISPLRVLDYSKDMKYSEVLESQDKLAEMINATKDAENEANDINSIVKLLALTSAASVPKLNDASKETLALDVINSQMSDMRKMIESFMMDSRHRTKYQDNGILRLEYEQISAKLDELDNMPRIKGTKFECEFIEKEYHKLMTRAEEIMMHCENNMDGRIFRILLDRMHRQMSSIELL